MHGQKRTALYNFNVECVLILSPYRVKTKGIGNMIRATNPSIEVPHPYPIAAYIFGPASGRTAATTDRRTVLAAIAEAAYTVKTSIK
jgi:hypothetical protein